MAIPCTAAFPPVVSAAPKALPTATVVRGTMVTGSRRTSVNEASTLRLTWAGLCEPRKRACSCVVVGTVPCCESWNSSQACKTRGNKTADVCLPCPANHFEALLYVLHFFIKVFVHVCFEHSITRRFVSKQSTILTYWLHLHHVLGLDPRHCSVTTF